MILMNKKYSENAKSIKKYAANFESTETELQKLTNALTQMPWGTF